MAIYIEIYLFSFSIIAYMAFAELKFSGIMSAGDNSTSNSSHISTTISIMFSESSAPPSIRSVAVSKSMSGLISDKVSGV